MRIISNGRTLLSLLLIGGEGVVSSGVGAVETLTEVVTNVAQFYRAANTGYNIKCVVRLEGVASWVNPSGQGLILEDQSGAVAILGGFEGVAVGVGKRVRLEGECTAQRSGLGLVMTQAWVVNNDGLHPVQEESGSVGLRAGFNPVRLVWFNRLGPGVLNVSYAGPGISRQAIPAAALYRPGEGTNLLSGLNYRCWQGEWNFISDLNEREAITNGVCTGFDVTVGTRPEKVGLEFSGYLKVPQGGRYTFYTESDDGSLLFAGPPSLQLTELGNAEMSKPRSIAVGQALSEAEEFQRCQVEATVRFVSERPGTTRLELKAGEESMLAQIAEAYGADARLLHGRRVRVVGICLGTYTLDGSKVAGYVWVPSWNEVEMLASEDASAEPEADGGTLPLLTTIEQVRRLNPEAASRAYPVRVRGVVTASSPNRLDFVVQEADHGIYVVLTTGKMRGRLEIGEACEITGTTRAAAWAPMIDAQQVLRLGLGRLPEPLRPSWDQILNGSFDSQYIELQGIVTAVRADGVELLTRMGKVEMSLGGKSREEWRQFEAALVRVRGCAIADYKMTTRQAISGKIRLVQPSIAVDRWPPAEPFAIPPKQVGALRSFDSEASPFQLVKVSGQVVHAQNGPYCLMEGTNGLRFFPKRDVRLPIGALVEVAGLPDMSGPSPALREAVVRVQQRSALPEARTLTGTNLLSGVYDATLVRMESLLLNVSREAGDQVLELRTGPHVHRARLPTSLGLLKPIPIGSRLALTGVYLGKGGNWAVGQDVEGFDLVLNSPADIKVLERPSWWTPRRLLGLAGSLGAVLLLALGWIRVLHRQVEERTRQLEQQIQARERVEQQRALEQERTRLARDLHDDLGGGLTEISMLGSLANDRVVALERKAGYLQQMTEKARQLVSALDEIVWAVNPRYDSLPSLAGYYSLYAQRFLSLASLGCHLEVAERLPDCPLDSKVRHSLFLAFKEALNNVVRHAEASEVRLRIRVEGEEMIVAITDNGRGLQAAAGTAPGKDGLANMRERLSALGGRCEIHSAPGQGTTVLFGVRLPKDSNNDQSSHH